MFGLGVFASIGIENISGVSFALAILCAVTIIMMHIHACCASRKGIRNVDVAVGGSQLIAEYKTLHDAACMSLVMKCAGRR